MKKKIKLKAYAKLNLFLKVINKRKDGYHNIISNLIFLNLHDEIEVSFNKKNFIEYNGKFKPNSKFFDNDIIIKTLKFLNIKQPLKIKIKKNIPTKAGLGSASANAAGLIKALEYLNLTKIKDYAYYAKLGSDIPACLLSKNCLVRGRGEKIHQIDNFKKYLYILIKPDVNISTIDMYGKVSKKKLKKIDKKYDKKNIINHTFNFGNDFENIAIKKNKKIKQLLQFLSSLEDAKHSGMSGSGSCCYSIFESKKNFYNAYKKITKKFPKYWSFKGYNLK